MHAFALFVKTWCLDLGLLKKLDAHSAATKKTAYGCSKIDLVVAASCPNALLYFI